MFLEFPKWLHFNGKPSVLVHDAEEEAKIFGETVAPETESEKDALLKMAGEKCIQIDKRWGVEKLKSVLGDL